MSKNTKLLVLELDYELKDSERTDTAGKTIPYAQVSRNLINMAFQINHAQGMDSKTAKTWRSIRKQLESAIDDGKNYVILSQSDSDAIYDEVYKCKYEPSQSMISPYLCDELDKVKNRSAADEDTLQEEILKLAEDIEHEMSERDRDQLIPDAKKDIVKKTLAEVS